MTKPLYIIQHVAKCGGTSIRIFLEKHLSSDEFWQLYTEDIYEGHSQFIGKFRNTKIDTINDAINSMDKSKVKAIIGHFVHMNMHKLFPDRDVRYITMTRNPLDFLQSKFNDRRAHMFRGSCRGAIGSTGYFECSEQGFMKWFNQPGNAVMPFYQYDINIDNIYYVFHQPELTQDLEWLADELGIPQGAKVSNSSRTTLEEYGQKPFIVQVEFREWFNEHYGKRYAKATDHYQQLMKKKNDKRQASSEFDYIFRRKSSPA